MTNPLTTLQTHIEILEQERVRRLNTPQTPYERILSIETDIRECIEVIRDIREYLATEES